ncbi:MAG: tetratricopeptide repeat protein [Scytonema sp. PMC 1070.18]|nr:tetratricopeptide repeat protein [Scytonema sp. PMC 1070.18]
MNFKTLPKSWKPKNRNSKLFFLFFAVSLISFILLVPTIPSAFSYHISQISAPECRRAQTGNPRSPNNSDIPTIITPRQTLILSDKPTFRWKQVLGTKSYEVKLQKGDTVVWQTKTDSIEVVYPGKPKLEPGIEYLLVVTADNNKSSTEEEPQPRGFRLLPQEEAEVVKTAIAQLNKKEVPDKVKALGSTYLYIGSELKAEAIQTLEALVASGTKETVIYRNLGNLYWQTGVSSQAEINYLNAHKLAKAAKDTVEQTSLAEFLGILYVDIGDEKTGIDWLTQAREGYKSLGNKQQVEKLNEQIKTLKSARLSFVTSHES